MRRTKSKAFSMLELIAVLGLMGVILVMMSNILVTTILISQKSAARAFVREEVAQTVELLISDLRRANTVDQCNGSGPTAICVVTTDQAYTWAPCVQAGSICKTNAAGTVIYRTSPNVRFSVFSLEAGFESGVTGTSRRNVLITLVAEHVIEKLNVKNVIRQQAVSTRNYLLL
jgi:type II secretory pathway pseudopilin PulG